MREMLQNDSAIVTGGQRVELHVPFVAILKVALSLLLFAAIVKLVPVLILLVMAVLLAVSLQPVVDWLVGRGVRRGLAVEAIAFSLIVVLAMLFAVVFPAIGTQIKQLMNNLPAMQARVTATLPALSPIIRALVTRLTNFQKSVDLQLWMRGGLAVGTSLTSIGLVLVLTLYFLLDGRGFYAWLVSYVPRRHRQRVAETADETSKVIKAYMRGQVITSVLCGIWVYGMLLLLDIPAALPLAIIAAIADVIPVVGDVIMTLPGVLVAFAVSPLVAFEVLAGYALYLLIENYWVSPHVYGKQMRLSTIAVLLSITVGGSLLGAAGAVLALPFVAAYPIIERLWLGNHLALETIEDHAALRHKNADHETTSGILGKTEAEEREPIGGQTVRV